MNRWIVGIDEAGRGALAGPVAVGLCAVREKSDQGWLEGVRDSKQLSARARETWFEQLSNQKKARWGVVQISNKEIDKKGMSKCVAIAIERLLKDFPDNSIILLDGLLKAPLRFKNQTTIIRGDQTEPLISMASIAAKVTRDTHMTKLARRHPYSFDIHKGYGTKLHRDLIQELGPCSLHRLTYLSRILP